MAIPATKHPGHQRILNSFWFWLDNITLTSALYFFSSTLIFNFFCIFSFPYWVPQSSLWYSSAVYVGMLMVVCILSCNEKRAPVLCGARIGKQRHQANERWSQKAGGDIAQNLIGHDLEDFILKLVRKVIVPASFSFDSLTICWVSLPTECQEGSMQDTFILCISLFIFPGQARTSLSLVPLCTSFIVERFYGYVLSIVLLCYRETHHHRTLYNSTKRQRGKCECELDRIWRHRLKHKMHFNFSMCAIWSCAKLQAGT